MGGIAKVVRCASNDEHPIQRVELLADDVAGKATPHVYVTDANTDAYIADFAFGGGGGGGGDVTGVKGDAEQTYRTGNVNLTPENVGAAAAAHTHSAASIISWLGSESVNRAVADAHGDDIAETYAKIDDIHDYAEVVIASVAEVRSQLVASGWTVSQGA